MKALLIRLRDNLPLLFELSCFPDEAGLCTAIIDPHFSQDEYDKLKVYLKENLPVQNTISYSWEPGKIEPRVKWLNEQIEKLD